MKLPRNRLANKNIFPIFFEYFRNLIDIKVHYHKYLRLSITDFNTILIILNANF
jgi:hypothetical protein